MKKNKKVKKNDNYASTTGQIFDSITLRFPAEYVHVHLVVDMDLRSFLQQHDDMALSLEGVHGNKLQGRVQVLE